jgi:N-methylhydantoinase A/oxoprolinase/acetone carboxylase beta subunit
VPGSIHSPSPSATPSPMSALSAVTAPSPSAAPSPGATPTPFATRPVCFDPARGFVDTAIYRRDDLGPGDHVDGPAVVEEYGATVPLHPGFGAEVDRLGNLIVSRPHPDRPGQPDPEATR